MVVFVKEVEMYTRYREMENLLRTREEATDMNLKYLCMDEIALLIHQSAEFTHSGDCNIFVTMPMEFP